MDPYWPHIGSIRIHIKAILGPYGFLSCAFLDRMVLYEAILVSCEFMLGTFWDPTDLETPTKINLGFAAQRLKMRTFCPSLRPQCPANLR